MEGPVFVTQPTLTVLATYTGDILNDDTFDQVFDRLFEGQTVAGVTKNEGIVWPLDQGFRWNMDVGSPTFVVDEADQTQQPDPSEYPLFAAWRYETEAVVEQQPNSGPIDSWSVTFDLPCRGLTLVVTPPPGQIVVNPICGLDFSLASTYGDAPPPLEGTDGKIQADGTAMFEFDYPETGSTFNFL